MKLTLTKQEIEDVLKALDFRIEIDEAEGVNTVITRRNRQLLEKVTLQYGEQQNKKPLPSD